MIQAYINNPLFSAWPFWIFELDPSADTRLIEKTYAKIIGAINLQIPNAECYATPTGIQIRDEFQLREAKSILMNPELRLIAEFWYVNPSDIADQENLRTEGSQEKPNWKKLLRTI